MKRRQLSENVRRAIYSGPIPTLRDWRSIPIAERTRAEKNMTFIEAFCLVPDGRLVGQPVVLIEAQEALFYAIYDNAIPTVEAIWSIGRKNSKTATIAFIVLLHLLGPEAKLNSEICSGARSRDQAGQVFKFASKTLNMSPKFAGKFWITPSQKTITGIKQNVTYKALSADATTQIGGSPILTIIDEAGQIKGPTDAFVEAITTGMGAHDNPLTIVISTQAATDADWLSIKIDSAKIGEDQSIVCHVYEAPDNCDIDDRAAWAMANPALGIFKTVSSVEKLAKDAMKMPSQEASFRNLQLNQRVNVVAPFISKAVWQACSGPVHDFDGPVYGGLDLSSVSDLTALVYVSEKNGIWGVKPTFWLPEFGLVEKSKSDRVPYDVWSKQGFLNTTPGRAINYDFVAALLWIDFNEFDLRKIAFDQWNFDHLVPCLYRAGFKEEHVDGDNPVFVRFAQRFKDMSPALRTLEAVLLEKELVHDSNPTLTMCVANAVVSQDAAGNRMLQKSKATGRIDGMVSLAMAISIGKADMENQEPNEDDYFAALRAASKANEARA